MKDYSDIIAIIDRSGSMKSMQEEAIGAFNAFLEQQKELPDEASMTLVLFDNEYLKPYEALPLSDVKPLDNQSFVPRGTTALLDAVGRSIDDAGRRFAAMPENERPAQVIVCILTDGKENASSDYTQARVADMIKHQREKYSWAFVFLAANQDAFETGASLNIPAAHTHNYQATGEGTKVAFRKMSASVSKLRSQRKNDEA